MKPSEASVEDALAAASASVHFLTFDHANGSNWLRSLFAAIQRAAISELDVKHLAEIGEYLVDRIDINVVERLDELELALGDASHAAGDVTRDRSAFTNGS